ncbi:MAG TPA: DUF167 domain-containing protein [Candidatus Norongarragalinales archaeon]|jgi:hypothetical protein|nr:DUF167 domain-containing protein [Candidatus Norongarragalinales archaeon]
MRVEVKVVPGASKSAVVEEAGGLKVRVAAPPEKGKANEELLSILAEHFGVKKRQLRIVSGASSRKKIIEIS